MFAEVKEEMFIAFGINDFDDSLMKKFCSGYKMLMWWEEECDDEDFDVWCM